MKPSTSPCGRSRRGQNLFNEAAFNAGTALYDGELLGHPYRHVAMSFQVRTWRELSKNWSELLAETRAELTEQFPALEFG
jgi:hypothetical protein